jgi:Ca-activated chloride channel homolog
LGRMASETGGKYYRAETNQGIKKVFDDIDSLEKTKIEVNEYTKYEELYERWLKWSVGLLLAGLLLGQTILRRVP